MIEKNGKKNEESQELILLGKVCSAKLDQERANKPKEPTVSTERAGEHREARLVAAYVGFDRRSCSWRALSSLFLALWC